MTAQDYIQTKLDDLRQPLGLPKPSGADELSDAIYRSVLSKKFRKYAANDELKSHIRDAIRVQVNKNEPINLTFLHGAYKLWRLDESPEADWAELFSLMYYSNWVKPVCEMYGPGVWFDFFVDDLIVPKLDNVDMDDIETYIDSYRCVMDFLKPYQPANLNMTITTVGSRFESPHAFDDALTASLEDLRSRSNDELPVLSDAQRAMVELNTKVTPEQAKDAQWREKVWQLHNAYAPVKGGTGYYKNRPDKILAFTQGLTVALCVGSTKDSIMKFWVGAGVLKPTGVTFRQVIHSPAQMDAWEYDFEPVTISGLSGKNFHKIQVMR